MKSKRPVFHAMLFLAVLCSVFFLPTRAWAQGNLLTNPGFESGSFGGWSVTGTSPTYGVSTAGFIIPGTNPPTPVVVHSGNYAGYALVCSFCTEDGDYLELSQTVTLVPGDIYTVAFWLGNGSAETYGNQSGVRLNGTDLNMTTFPPDVIPGYQVESGSFIATQANSTFTFHIEGSGTAPAGFSFDDFSVTQTGSPATNGGYLYQIRTINQVADFQVNINTGALVQGVNSPFPTGNNPSAAASNGALTYVADQSSSQISAYVTNQTTGTMTPVSGSPYTTGLTPVGIALDRSLHFLYACGNEHGNGAVAGWSYNPLTGALTPVSGSPFPAGSNPGAIAFSRNGQYLYVTDRFASELLAYSINTMTGALTELAGSPYHTGSYPIALATDTVGNYLYVADAGGNTISAFAIASDGELTPVPGSPFAAGSSPFSLALDKAQRYLYAANDGSSNISAYQINSSTGALTPINGSPFTTGANPNSIASSNNFLYVNAPPSIYGYQINSATGALTPISGSPFPYQGHGLASAGTGVAD